MRVLFSVIALCLGLLFAHGARADAMVSGDLPPGLQIPDAARAGPKFDVDRATDSYVALLTPAQREKSDAYFEGGYWLQLWGFCYGLGVSILLLATRWSRRMANPVRNSIVRQAEAEADAFGLDAAREPNGFAMAAMRLSTYRKIHPGRWEEILFYDHPSGYARVHGSMLWLKENQDNATANAPLPPPPVPAPAT